MPWTVVAVDGHDRLLMVEMLLVVSLELCLTKLQRGSLVGTEASQAAELLLLSEV